jgi:hypothetical protein
MNADNRGCYLDGEVLFALAGPWALSGYGDFVFLAGSTTWIETQEELNRLLPPYSERQRRRAYWSRKAIRPEEAYNSNFGNDCWMAMYARATPTATCPGR